MSATIQTRVCTRCGAPLANNPPEGLCPKCLLAAAINQNSDAQSNVLEPTVVMQNPAEAITQRPLNEPFPIVRYFGDYELHGEIARGGMGVVHRARQVSLNRPVALKMILAGQLATEAEVKRFRREAEAAANLQHPHIVAIHEIGEHEGQHFYSMDFIDGPSLAERLREGALPIGEAVGLLKILAETVQFAHERGVLHRDLKPGNVLMDKSSQPHLTDFGLAKRNDREDQLTLSGTALGTPSYAAPEQIAGRLDLVGPASDVYSLGAILYEMLTGVPPLRGRTLSETITQVIEKNPKPPSQLNPRVPKDLEAIVLKSLEKRIDQRYPSAGELAQDLGRFLNHQPLSIQTPPGWYRVAGLLTFHPRVLAAMSTVGFLTLIFFGYNMWVETRMLTWENQFPGELKPAPFILFIDPWTNPVPLIGIFAGLFIEGLSDLLRKRARKRILNGAFSSSAVLRWFKAGGILGIVAALLLGAGEIQIYQWSRHAAPLARSGADGRLRTGQQLGLKFDISRVQYTRAERLEYQGKARTLLFTMMFPAFGVWAGTSLFLNARREQRFVFYLTAREERFAREFALAEQELESAESERRIVTARAIGFLACALLVILPNFYWVRSADERMTVTGIVAQAAACAFALGLTRFAIHKLSGAGLKILWIEAAALVMATAFVRTASTQIALSMGLGLFNGVSFGLFLWWKKGRSKLA